MFGVHNQASGSEHDKKRKRQESLNLMPKVEEVWEQGFPVLIDWSASNGSQNAVWRSNVQGLTGNDALDFTETESESYEDVLARNEIEMEAIIEHQNDNESSIGRAAQGDMKKDQEATIPWDDLSGSLRLEIFDNLSSRFGKDAARKGLNLTQEQMDDITQMAEHYNEQNTEEDKTILLMQKDQLNAILRADHSTASTGLSQATFESITDRHLSWIHGGTRGEQHVCKQHEFDLALRFLRQKTLDPSLLGEWSKPRFVECANTRERFRIHDVNLTMVSEQSDRESRQPSDQSKSGYVITDDSARRLQPQDILQKARLNIKAPKPVGRPKGSKSLRRFPAKHRRHPSPSPLHNELPTSTNLPSSQNNQDNDRSKFASISKRPATLKGGAKTSRKTVPRSLGRQASSEVNLGHVRKVSGQRPDTPTEASSSPDVLASGPTRSLRARSELRPSRAALEMEETGLLLRHRGGQLGENTGRNSPDINEEDGNEIPPKKLVVLKLNEKGRAYLRKAKASASSKPVNKTRRNLGIFTGLSTTLSPMKPLAPRPAPLLPPKEPVRRQVIGWNPSKRPPNFPNPPRINTFTRQLLELGSRDTIYVGKAEEQLKSNRRRKKSTSGPSPDWSPISNQDNPEQPSKPTAGDESNNGQDQEPPSSPQFAAPIKNLLNVSDPGSPLLSRTKSLSNLLTPRTSPAKHAADPALSIYSSGETSQPMNTDRETKPDTKGVKGREDKATVRETPPPIKITTPKRPYSKTSPYWINKSTGKKSSGSTLQGKRPVETVSLQNPKPSPVPPTQRQRQVVITNPKQSSQIKNDGTDRVNPANSRKSRGHAPTTALVDKGDHR